MKLLLITSCSSPTFWYADLIGDILPYYGEYVKGDLKEYQTCCWSGDAINYVDQVDAEIVEMEEI